MVRNSTFGFEVELPDGWPEMSANSFYENLGKIKLDDPKFQEALKKNANAPVIIATKYPEPFDDINPSLKINVRPYGSLKTRDAMEITKIMTVSVGRLFKDLEVVEPPSHEVIGGKEAGHARVKYTLKTDAAEFPLESELWIVPTENYFLMIGIGYRQDGKTGTRDEAALSVSSIKFVGQ
jgi:hypothetical protein